MHITHYLDNYTVIGLPDSETCTRDLPVLKGICKDM